MGIKVWRSEHSTYCGEWKQDDMDGQVTTLRGNKQVLTFLLQGHLTLSSKEYYVGGFTSSNFHSTGKVSMSVPPVGQGLTFCGQHHWPDASEFYGQYVAGREEGDGVIETASGWKYNGCWLGGKVWVVACSCLENHRICGR